MSRKELKFSAKQQISGNVFILFLFGLIANVFIWYSSFQSAFLNSSGILKNYMNSLMFTSKMGAFSADYYNTLYSFFGMMVGSSLIVTLLDYAIGSPLRISLSHTYLELASNDSKPVFSMLGFGFKKCWLRSVLLKFLSGLFIGLWTLLLIIPGIIKSYSYAMANYIMAENPEISALDAITKSRKLMDGHKFELFVLDLSFFFWYLLVAITFGLAMIYVGPYMEAAKTNFYLNIKSKDSEVVA